MIFLFFAVMFAVLYLYFKQTEQKDDYILIAIALIFLFLQVILLNDGAFYEKLTTTQNVVCSYDYNYSSDTCDYPMTISNCSTTYDINTNMTFGGIFSGNDYYGFKAFDSNILSVSIYLVGGLLIIGTLYVLWKAFMLFGLIKP